MADQLVCGIDSSTQSTKVELREAGSGQLVATGRGTHPATAPPASEQDPRVWWSALRDALGEVGGHLADVAAVAVAGQQHALVLVDDAGDPLRPAKLWNDTTSAPHASALVEHHGAREWAADAGSVPVASFTVTKLAWVADNEPEVLDRTRRIMLPHDYLTWRLTGEHITDRGDASGTGWWSPRDGTYARSLLGLVVDDPDGWLERLPRVLGPDEPAGRVTTAAAAATGLPAGALVTCGTGDNMAAALGLGLEPGDMVMSLGTSGTVYAVSDEPTSDASGLVAGFADATGRYLPLVCTLNATGVTEMVAGWLGVEVDALADLALDAGTPDTPLILVPYLEGERTPDLPTATGLLTGVRRGTGRADLARATHLGVLCGLFAGVDALTRSGVTLGGRRLLVGGGARSAAFRAFAADLWQAPVVVPAAEEAVAAGACVQAASGLHGEPSGDVARRWSLGTGTTIEPPGLVDTDEVRAAYADAADAAARLADRPPVTRPRRP
jgi:xylulokinase